MGDDVKLVEIDNVREKLIELLASKPELLQNLNVHISKLFKLADHLIANGVTFATDNNVGGKWIPVTERLPEERDSIFAKWYMTEIWRPGMYCTVSNNVIACVEIGSRTRLVTEAHTKDGKWNVEGVLGGWRVTHWMPMPEPPKGE